MTISVLDAWQFVNDDDPNLQSTGSLSSGSNRVLVMAYAGPNHDIDAFGWTVTSVSYGNEAATATYQFGDGTDDSARYVALWNDAAIQAATDQQFRWSATNIINEFFGWAVYEGVQQSGLDSLVTDSTNYATNQSTSTLTTTSSSGDRIIVWGGINTGARQVSDWDTLTEQHDFAAASGNAKYCLGEGNGGDNSTVVTNTTFGRPNFASIVLVQAGASSIIRQAAYHYRNHGKI